MYRSNVMRIPRPQPAEYAPHAAAAPSVRSDDIAAADAKAHEAAATLACRTSIGSETMGADGKAAIVLSLLGIMFTVVARFGW